MHVVVFEVIPNEGRAHEYFDLAKELASELQKIDGFVSVERFESLTERGKYLSLSTWRDEAAIKIWRGHAEHQMAQARGKGGIFKHFRIRVAAVVRDYDFRDERAATHAASER
ncbi:MAG TPA: antibiotic biosynthesis monooxygenase [Alphaproteobacteria bacterium]|nr:antibiotic biosynthesis monooxygenase [Alphaproteobacteria bacterium]